MKKKKLKVNDLTIADNFNNEDNFIYKSLDISFKPYNDGKLLSAKDDADTVFGELTIECVNGFTYKTFQKDLLFFYTLWDSMFKIGKLNNRHGLYLIKNTITGCSVVCENGKELYIKQDSNKWIFPFTIVINNLRKRFRLLTRLSDELKAL